jgi:cytosine/adenosine deaminase-related metal-dependent hydrolase
MTPDPVLPVLIRNAMVLTMDRDRRILPRADLLLSEGRVAAIGLDLAPGDARVIDAGAMLAVPGLINAHLHSPGNLMRGCLDGMPLEIFMLYEVPPLASETDESRLAYLRTAIGAIEMLKLGITAVGDDAFFVPTVTNGAIDAIMSAYRDAGMRASVAIDQPNIVEYAKHPFLEELLPHEVKRSMDAAPRQSGEALLAHYAHLVERWHGAAEGRLRAAVSCSAPQRVTPAYLAALSQLSRARDLPFFIHILESKTQRVFGEEKLGKSLVRLVHDLGHLDARMLVMHAIWIDDEDIALLARAGATVSHNPICNLRLGSGVMPFRALRRADVAIALGSDEATVDDTHNLWLVAKTAGLVHTLSDPEYRDWPRAGEVLDCLFHGGARALRRPERIGVIEVGAAADIALLDLESDAFTPLNDVVRQLVFCETGSSVRHVFVGGRQVVVDGAIATIDEKAIKAEVRALAPKLAAEMVGLRQAASALEPAYREMYRRAMARDVGMNRRIGR